MSWTFCSSLAAVAKAGAGANSSIVSSGAIMTNWSNEVEATICAITAEDWIAEYSSVAANYKPILEDTASDMIAMKIVSYDMSGYFSRLEAQTILDVLKDNSTRNLEILKDENKKKKMNV